MDIQGVAKAMLKGFVDSFIGMRALLYLDAELNKRRLQRFSPSRSTPIRRKQSDVKEKEETPSRALKEHEESKVLKRTIQCGLLNGGLFVTSIWFFEYLLLPFISLLLRIVFGENSTTGDTVWYWIKPFLSLIFKTCWVIPLFLISKVVNSLWFQDIADSAYKYSRGRPTFMQSLSKLIADLFFSVVVQTLFLFQAVAVSIIPIYMLGYLLSLVHVSMLYALYAFEYKWFNMGLVLHQRLTFIETNWPYFIGFGLPLTLACQITDSWLLSGGIFSILFPFFIISANEATPVTGVNTMPLHLFSPVITISNTLLRQAIKNQEDKRAPLATGRAQR